MVMSVLDGLILAVSCVAMVLSLFALLRAPTETVRRMAQDAHSQAIATKNTLEGAIVQLNATRDAVDETLERATKDRQRARAERQRAEEARGGNAGMPQSREEQMIELRRRAGIV